MPKPPKTRCQPWLDGGEPETKAVLYINLARLLNYANNPVKDDWASDSSESRAGLKISMLAEWSLENQFDSGSAWHLHAIISEALYTILSIVISHSSIALFQLSISLQIDHGIRPTKWLNTWIKQPRRPQTLANKFQNARLDIETRQVNGLKSMSEASNNTPPIRIDLFEPVRDTCNISEVNRLSVLERWSSANMANIGRCTRFYIFSIKLITYVIHFYQRGAMRCTELCHRSELMLFHFIVIKFKCTPPMSLPQ